jgi:hypothetical protein
MRLGYDDSAPLEQQPRPQLPLVPLLTPRPQNVCVGESSTGTGYVSPYVSYGSGSFYVLHFGAHSPRLNASACYVRDGRRCWALRPRRPIPPFSGVALVIDAEPKPLRQQ